MVAVLAYQWGFSALKKKATNLAAVKFSTTEILLYGPQKGILVCALVYRAGGDINSKIFLQLITHAHLQHWECTSKPTLRVPEPCAWLYYWHAVWPVARTFLFTCVSFPICNMGRAILTPCLKLFESCWQGALDNEAAVFITQISYLHGQGTVALHCSNLEHLQQFRIPDWLNSDGRLNLKHVKTQPKSQPHYETSFEMWWSGSYCFSNPQINKIPRLLLFSNSAQKKVK